MNPPRVEPLMAPYPEDVAEVLASMMPPGAEPIGLFRTVAHSPKMLAKLRASSMLGKVSLSLRQREILILRTTARARAEYEWGVHVNFFAEKAGFSRPEVSAISFSNPVECGLAEEESVLLQLVDDLATGATVSDQTWVSLEEHFSAEQILEMIMLVGMYHTVSFLCNGLAIANEQGTPGFNDYADETVAGSN